MNAKLLIVEDEPVLLTGLEALLRTRRYQVETSARGDEGLEKAMQGDFDLVLLDVMLPGLSGFDVLKRLREQDCEVPVILLTARGDEMDRVLGFELGVDDYVTKPFSPMELLGRVAAVLKRARPVEKKPQDASVLRFGPVEVDLERYAVSGAPDAEMPAKAFDILRALARTPGKAVNRNDLMDAVWGADEFLNERTLNNLVGRIRAVIEGDPRSPSFLKTIHGVGYRLDLG